jgi:hypothetical protein
VTLKTVKSKSCRVLSGMICLLCAGSRVFVFVVFSGMDGLRTVPFFPVFLHAAAN